MLHELWKMEVFLRIYIPVNLEHWKLFNDDAQILCFLQISNDFSNNQVNFLAESMSLRVEKLPNYTLPNGVIPLERMLDRNDMCKGKPIIDQFHEAFEYNLGSENNPRMIKTVQRETLPMKEKT